MENQPRSDRGKVRKVVLEDVLEAIRKVRPKAHGKTPTLALLYRLCIEEGLLTRARIAPNTFRRVVKQYELLKPDEDCVSKHRLAFAKAHANEMWQADTLYGPHVQVNGSPVQTRLYKGERMGEARLLDPIANDRKPSASKKQATQEKPV